MGVTKVMIIRHAEKPGIYHKVLYNGINAVGQQDPASLVTMGWERAGGVTNLFYPGNGLGPLPTADLSIPDYIYASNPYPQVPTPYTIEPNGNIVAGETSQRPYQTISALSAKMGMTVNVSFDAKDYDKMVKDVLAIEAGSATSPVTVLIAWQHQDVLPQPTAKPPIAKSILTEFLTKTNTVGLTNIPPGPWPSDRYDMVFVLDRPTGKGVFTAFTQVPQQLLAGDKTSVIGFPKPLTPVK